MSNIARALSEEGINRELVSLYYNKVQHDYDELKEVYPYSRIINYPTLVASQLIIRVIAVDHEIIKITGATEDDCICDYSRELIVEIPIDYQLVGCDVYGGKWIDRYEIPEEEQHFYGLDADKGYKLCVGVPESFKSMNNVILENVRTADHILTAYADYLSGRTNRIVLSQFPHGERGINEFRKSKRQKS